MLMKADADAVADDADDDMCVAEEPLHLLSYQLEPLNDGASRIQFHIVSRPKYKMNAVSSQ